MVRVFIKGGVWKNSEDEILKAAVMKYGKQQWARVASLLNRKSAKQCKARWHEWLDPSVRKVEWSRAEEEKLLHLAKLMPAQWKTIGPLVGRTATQCQEHYEKLLDEAATSAAAAADGSAGSAAAASTTASLRQQVTSGQLRPGQIDSHPETKPARPDPIDMDEDEIEMLQEARARLANTQGKKAKRKAREKMLAEAKRLADLQKRRELKQAGLLSSAARKKARKKNRDIDLGVEIPFHKPAPAGFHDVSSEDVQSEQIRQKRLRQIDYKRINENQYRARDREAKQAEKREEARIRNLERSNMQYVVAQVSKTNDPLSTRKRGTLELPAPTVSDNELNQLAKLTDAQQKASSENSAMLLQGNSATQALLGDYSDRPLPTPMRTPMSQSGGGGMSTHEVILREASNLRMLEQGQTPLLGGENPELKTAPVTDSSSNNGAAGAGFADTDLSAATPMLEAKMMGDRGQTPMTHRDELGLNRRRPRSEMRSVGGGDNDDVSVVSASTFATTTTAGGGSRFTQLSIKDLAREERRAAKRARRELEEALAALPAPQYEYDLMAPQDIPDDDDDDNNMMVVKSVDEMDAADVDAAELERQKREAECLYEARSSVVKRLDLPRPTGVVPDSYVGKAPAKEEDPSSFGAAERLIRQEMVTLLHHDAHAHPVETLNVSEEKSETSDKSSKKKKKRKKSGKEETTMNGAVLPPETPLDNIPEETLDMAKSLIETELDNVWKAKTNGLLQSEAESIQYLSQENKKASDIGASGMHYSEEKRGWTKQANKQVILESLKNEFDTLQKATSTMRKKNDKLETKITIKNGGYSKRTESMRQDILNSFAQLQNSQIEEVVFTNLQSHEDRGSAMRIEKLKDEIQALEENEAIEQKRYSDLLLEKKRFMVLRNEKKDG